MGSHVTSHDGNIRGRLEGGIVCYDWWFFCVCLSCGASRRPLGDSCMLCDWLCEIGVRIQFNGNGFLESLSCSSAMRNAVGYVLWALGAMQRSPRTADHWGPLREFCNIRKNI